MAQRAQALFRELKRRHVLRTCLLYVVLCWGVLQVGDILFPALGLQSEAASRIALFSAVLGFPLIFVLAWVYQVTPQGLVRTEPFIERRMLANIPPLNERRGLGWRQYVHRDGPDSDFRWVLQAESGPLSGLEFGIDRPLIIGRAADCDLAMASPQLSRHHAQLEIEGEALYVADLNSVNGTRVNERRIDGRQPLYHGDRLQCHDITFIIRERGYGTRQRAVAMEQTTVVGDTDDTVEQQRPSGGPA